MADQEDIKLSKNLKRIVEGEGENARFPIMSGKVLSVDVDKKVANVLLSVDDDGTDNEDLAIPVALNVINGNGAGMYLIPADKADCEVAEVDGPGKWSLIRATKYVKIIAQADTLIQFNDGGKGGLVQIEELKSNLNALKTYVEAMKAAVEDGMTSIGVGSGASGPNGKTAFDLAMTGEEINFAEMENKNVTHG